MCHVLSQQGCGYGALMSSPHMKMARPRWKTLHSLRVQQNLGVHCLHEMMICLLRRYGDNGKGLIL